MAKKDAIRYTNVAVFDISSSSVSGAHVSIASNPDPTKNKVYVHASLRKHAELKEDITIERFLDQTVSQLQYVLQSLDKQHKTHPHYIQVLLASPWFLCQTRTVVYNKTTEFTCTRRLVEDLVQKEVTYVQEHEMERFGAFGTESLIVEKQISQIKLNGYTTLDPFDKKARSLEISFVITLSPKVVIERFRKELHSYYHTRHIGFTTSPFATHIVTRDFFNAPDDSLIIDIGEEVTDIAFVKQNLFLYHHSFPLGGYEFYRAIESRNIAGIVEAEALLETFVLGKMADAQKVFIQQALNEYAQKWQRALQELVDSAGYRYLLPETIYVTGDYRFAQFFETLLTTDPLITHKTVTQHVQPFFITQHLLAPFFVDTAAARTDETVIIGALFASRLLY